MRRLILASLMLAGMTALAQPPRGGEKGRHAMKDLSAAELATLQSKRMTLALDLTDAQQRQVSDLLTKQIEERREARKSAGDSTRMRNYGDMNARLDRQIAFKRSLQEILTDAQYEQWQEHHANRRHYRHARRGHRRG